MLKHEERGTQEEKPATRKGEIKRTDQEGEDKSPYRQICPPHLDNDDTEHKHGY